MALIDDIRRAGRDGQILESTVRQIARWLQDFTPPDWAQASLVELVEAGAWEELNDRFFRDLAFGTGGMRGRTIGRVVTRAERGDAAVGATPAHASFGSNLLNDFTLVRATIGLFRHTAGFLRENQREDVPRLVIAHDVRHFSRHFCELAASTWIRLGGDAFIFDGPRSTPQLSFTVRHLRAHAGVVVTASHNPPHDNGFKAYFEDGGQVVSPHAEGIVDAVAAVALTDVSANLEKDLARIVILGPANDESYHRAAAGAVIDRERLGRAKLRVAFSSIHGTGAISAVPLLRAAGVEVHEVDTQRGFDPDFSTVKSPNPENADALALAVALAEEKRLDLVLATDPDGDRVGVAARDGEGRLVLLTGNQIGALLAEFRLVRLKQLRWIPGKGSERVALIKTFVTSPLQDAVGRAHGVKVINTLTGFKWIGARLARYEAQLRDALAGEGLAIDYDRTTLARRAKLLQKHSTFFAFGGEESYGYLPTDAVRDKDGNASCLAMCELLAHAKRLRRSLPDLLDDIYVRHGYHLEAVGQLTLEGAAGADQIRRGLESYRSAPPERIGELSVVSVTDFGRDTIHDADGETVPREDLFFVTFSNGWSCAVRGSGTEPKLKFYLFAAQPPAPAGELPAIKTSTREQLEALRFAVEADARARAGTPDSR